MFEFIDKCRAEGRYDDADYLRDIFHKKYPQLKLVVVNGKTIVTYRTKPL